MKYYKNYKLKLRPNRRAKEALQATLDVCCDLYNSCLQERRDAYKIWERHNKGYQFSVHSFQSEPNLSTDSTGTKVLILQYDVLNPDPNTHKPPTITRNSQSNELTAMKDEVPELQSVYDHLLRNVIDRVDTTYASFFRRVKNGQNPGFPRFKSKGRYNSFTYPDTQTIEMSNGLVR